MFNKKILLTVLAALLLVGLFSGCFEESEKKPDTPGNISTSVLTNGIRITWNPVSNTDNYVIYRREGTNGNGEQLTSDVNSSTDEYTDTTGTPGTSYSYAVAARNSVGTSDRSSWSEPKVFPGNTVQIPEAPSNVTAVAQSSSIITISWSGSTGAVGYKVYRDDSASGNFSNCVSGETPSTGTSYTDEGLQANKDYFYKISAVNTAGESDKSSPAATAKTGASNASNNVDFTSYNTPGSYVFRVRNNTNVRLIAFIKNITPSNLIGGVDAFENEHGFKKDISVLGNRSDDFPVIFITEEQYNANINNLAVLESTPFTRIYGYYNAVGSNEIVYDINAGLGGSYTLRVTPSLTRNVELRLGGPNGATLGYVTAQDYTTYFKMVEGFHRIFPIVRVYNPFRNEIISYTPTWNGGPMNGAAKSVSIGLDAGRPEDSINIHELLLGTVFTTGSAFIVVFNGGDSGVQVFNGGVVQMTSTGSIFVNPGETKMFQVNMVEYGDGTYAQTASVSTYRIGSNTINAGALGDVSLEVDKIYSVVVTGNDGGFSVTAPVDTEDNMEI